MKKYRRLSVKNLTYNLSLMKANLTQLILITSLILQPVALFAKENPNHSLSDFYRSEFFKLMPSESTLQQKQNLLYPVELIDTILKTPKENLSSIEDYFLEAAKNVNSPSQFLDTSIKKAPTTLQSSNFKTTPLIIIVPGIFAEFIKAHAFEDLLDTVKTLSQKPLENTIALSYKNQFSQKLSQYQKSSNQNPEFSYPLSDPQFNLSNVYFKNMSESELESYEQTQKLPEFFGKTSISIDKLILLGVLKNADGTLLANTLTLNTEELSLESLSQLRFNSKTFVRRLSKFFSVMGEYPDNIILAGYSRGAAIALDMISLTHDQKDCASFNESLDEKLERGCTVSNMMNNQNQRRWSQNIRSFLSVAGVLYGSELADVGFPQLHRNDDADQNRNPTEDSSLIPLLTKESPLYLQEQKTELSLKLKALTKLRNNLKFINKPSEEEKLWVNSKTECSSINIFCHIGSYFSSFFNNSILSLKDYPNKLHIFVSNTEAWLEFLHSLNMISLQSSGEQFANDFKDIIESSFKKLNSIAPNLFNSAESAKESTSTISEIVLNSLSDIFNLVVKVENDLLMNMRVDLNASLSHSIGLLKKAFGAENYNSNILRFKILVDKTIEASSDLTTAARLHWWRTHEIPTQGIKYYTLSATMDENDKNLVLNGTFINRNSDIQTNLKYCYNYLSVDFTRLLGSYHSLKSLGDLHNNDSQVSLHKSIFHPTLARLLNPKQNIFKATPLGLFHTHHWGLTLKTVTEIKDGNIKTMSEPFPRNTLLQSALYTMAADPEYPK